MLQNSNSENELRKLIESQLISVREKNINAILPFYSAEIVQFDVVNPLQYKGSNGIRKRMEEWFDTFIGNIEMDALELHITSNGKIGFAHCLKHVMGIQKTVNLICTGERLPAMKKLRESG